MDSWIFFLSYIRYVLPKSVLGAAARSNCQGRKSELEKAAKLEGASLPSSPTSKQGKTNSRIENSFREIAGKTVRKLFILQYTLGNITLLRLFWLGHLLHPALPSSLQPSQVLYRIPRGKSRRGKRWRHRHLSTYCKCNTPLLYRWRVFGALCSSFGISLLLPCKDIVLQHRCMQYMGKGQGYTSGRRKREIPLFWWENTCRLVEISSCQSARERAEIGRRIPLTSRPLFHAENLPKTRRGNRKKFFSKRGL